MDAGREAPPRLASVLAMAAWNLRYVQIQTLDRLSLLNKKKGARLFVDAIRTTDTFPTVSSRNRYVYFLNGSGGLNAYALTPGAYTGTTFAAELALKSGRSCTYQPSSNSIQLGYAEGTRVVWKDEELSGFVASSFPCGATSHDPKGQPSPSRS